MPLAPPVSRRSLRHTRLLQVEAFARDDGLWDLDAHISDTKTRDVILGAATRHAGSPIHDLKLRLTIDALFSITAVEAVSDAVPYPGYCDRTNQLYQPLIGLNLKLGFRQQLLTRLAGTAGCTHLTELAQILPTAAIQALSGEVERPHQSEHAEFETKPFQLDRCHALRTDGEVVAQFYPRWVTTASVRPGLQREPDSLPQAQADVHST